MIIIFKWKKKKGNYLTMWKLFVFDRNIGKPYNSVQIICIRSEYLKPFN